MKTKILFILLITFINLQLFSQDYDPMIKEGAFWDVNYTAHPCGGSCYCSPGSEKRYKIDNDTLINNKVYKKIKVYPIQVEFPENPPCAVGKKHFSAKKFYYDNKYIREDIESKKVFIWAKSQKNVYCYSEIEDYQELILYDFSVKKGDTIKNSYINITGCEYGIKDNLIINNISYDSDGKKIYNGHIKEGVGSTYKGLFNEINIAISHSSYISLYCYGNDENQNNCTEILSTNNYALSSIRVFPNPIKDILTIQSTEKIIVKLYSINGSLLKTLNSKSNLEIDVSSFKTGIYILEISNSTGSKKSKILKI